MHWHLYTAHALNLLLCISTLHGCRRKGVFTLVILVFSKMPVVCTTTTHLHTY